MGGKKWPTQFPSARLRRLPLPEYDDSLPSTPMPVHPSIATTRISQEDFKSLASEVMRHVFDIHNEYGRLFTEPVYKRELAARLPEVILEAPVTVAHGTFTKTYFLDALVRNSGLFEFKAADAIHPRHRGQTLNYLLLFDLAHGKIVNLRNQRVEHQFVNCPNRLSDLRSPNVRDAGWNGRVAGAQTFRDALMALIGDWGVGLDLALYEEALTHILGGERNVVRPVSVFGQSGMLAAQPMRLIAPRIAFQLTAIDEGREVGKPLVAFQKHARKLLDHTNLQAIHWANLTHRQITFTTLHRR
jgi:GxxExxY protein